MPNPCAAFSPLTTTKSSASSRPRRGTSATTAPRPAHHVAAQQQSHGTYFPEEVRMEPRRPSALVDPRGPLTQVGAIYQDQGPDRDSPRGVDIGPGVTRP